MPLIRKDDLQRAAGDTVKFDIALAMTVTGAAYQTGDTAILEGNEEKLVLRQAALTVGVLKHATRWSKLENILQVHNSRVIANNQLRKWLAARIDNRIFAEMTGETIEGYAPSIVVANQPTTMKWFAGSATSVATVADGDATGRLKLGDISDFKAYLQVTNKIEPIRMSNGEEVFGLCLDPYALLSLKKDTQFQAAQREAMARGADNPLFTGAAGMWDGVILYSSQRVPTAADGAGSIRVARNVFFGAQHCMRAYSWYPDWFEQDFSYGEESGVACYTVLGQKLIAFDLNAVETTGSTTDDTAIGGGILYSAAVAPSA